MKILRDKSPLNYLPKELNVEQLLIFDSIRITLEIIEFNFLNLQNSLLNISKLENKKENISVIFNYAWNIIDYTSRFIKIYKELPSESNYEVLNSIIHVNSFRNTLQHLNERINESLIINKSPFYGILIWFYKDPISNKTIPMNLISGINYGSTIQFSMPDLTKTNKEINDIWIQSVDKQKIINTNITKIIDDLKYICSQNEERLIDFCKINKVSLCDWSKQKDMIIKLNQR